jgi:hypothetical protein
MSDSITSELLKIIEKASKAKISDHYFEPIFSGSAYSLLHWLLTIAKNKFTGRSWATLCQDLEKDRLYFPQPNKLPGNLSQLKKMLYEINLFPSLDFITCSSGTPLFHYDVLTAIN